MSSFCVHPKQTPGAIIIVRHIMTVLSINLTTLCIYIVKKSPSVTKVYANLLVILLIASVLIDVFVQWIFDPVFLLPLICIYRNSPLLNIPFSSAACAAIVQSLVALSGILYFALFIYRHQVIISPRSRFKFTSSQQILFLAALSIPFAALGVTFYFGKVGARELAYYDHHLGDDWDSEILNRTHCFVQSENYAYNVLCMFVPIFSIVFITAIARHTFLILSKVKHISMKMQELHRILTRALIIQALIPVVIVLLPFLALCLLNGFFVTYYPEIMNDWAIDPADFVILIISFHSTTHSAALLLTTPAFRIQIYKMVSCQRENSLILPLNTNFTAPITPTRLNFHIT